MVLDQCPNNRFVKTPQRFIPVHQILAVIVLGPCTIIPVPPDLRHFHSVRCCHHQVLATSRSPYLFVLLIIYNS